FLVVLSVPSLVGLCGLEFNESHQENHRFATAILFFSALFALVCVSLKDAGWVGRACLITALALPALSTLGWLVKTAPHELGEYAESRLGEVDCRSQAGARFNEPTRHYYVAGSAWYVWASCRPTITIGGPPSTWPFTTDKPEFGRPALLVLDRLRGEKTLPTICPRRAVAVEEDPVCHYAIEHKRCQPAGSEVVSCQLMASDRRAILAL
ncbi:MAG TPA: hypothetical protein VK524_04195, partial [Polyangiaceae bacterium]|nr:hypothetical protein [Polyangiaceae bacterium]